MTEARSLLATIDPRRTAVVECSSVPLFRNEESAGSVAVLGYTPERVSMQVDAAGPALMVAAEGYHSGWHATIDGLEQAVCPANVAFMGVAVPAKACLDVGVPP